MSTGELNIADRIISRALLINLGTRVIYIIKERTLRGEFLPGSTGTSNYSTTPMPLPLGALPARARSKSALRALTDSGEATIFTSLRSRRTWIILEGGYKRLRELAGRESDRVTLNWSGSMMRNLKILRTNEREGYVELGFNEGRAARLARYHHELGAGRRKVTHRFLGLTDTELASLEPDVREHLRMVNT